MKGIQDTTTSNFESIISSGKKFRVPKFQRDYSWEKEQWDDLWQDIELMIANEDDHYMGYLVLQATEGNEYQIIDGQQRFTTISLLILAVIKRIQNLGGEDETRRAKSLLDDYIGRMNPITLEYDNKLVLNRNNDKFYKDYLVKFDKLRHWGQTGTEKLMRGCFDYFYRRLGEGRFQTYKGEQLAGYIIKVVQNLWFTKLTVTDEANAFKVFETLNARGVQLSSADLLKNYLFSIVDGHGHHEEYIERLEERWAELTQTIRSEKLPEFIRYYWNCSHPSIRARDLFSTIRKEIKTEREVFGLMESLSQYGCVYSALHDRESDFWENDRDLKELVGLLNLFGLKQPFSLLMTGCLNLERDEFKRLFRTVFNFCFRYNVICDKNPNDQEEPFNRTAMSITANKRLDLSPVGLISISDEPFKEAFSKCSMSDRGNNGKKIRYILGEIEKSRGGVKDVPYEEGDATLEHILPKEYSESWTVEDEAARRMVNRLGNMCLLESKKNRDLQNCGYERKREVYRGSVYQTTRRIAERFESWDEDSVNRRQRRMGEAAATIWKVQTEAGKGVEKA